MKNAIVLMMMPVWSAAAGAADAGIVSLNPAAIRYTLPANIPWTDAGSGAMTATLVGDPAKPGLYVILIKWLPHHMSRPHWHPNDRFITVISGTWWVGTGQTFDADATVPLPAGSFVRHIARQVHYDGAKDDAAVLQIVGMGPATATDAEITAGKTSTKTQ